MDNVSTSFGIFNFYGLFDNNISEFPPYYVSFHRYMHGSVKCDLTDIHISQIQFQCGFEMDFQTRIGIINGRETEMSANSIKIGKEYFKYMAKTFPVMCASDEFYFFPRAENSINFFLVLTP